MATRTSSWTLAKRMSEDKLAMQMEATNMKTLFLGGLAARVAPRILGKMAEKLDDTAFSPNSTTCSG